MGEIGIFIGSGFKPKTAIYVNIIGNFSTFIGVAIGLLIGTLDATVNIIALCVVAGNFLYIGMTLMLPNILNLKGHGQDKKNNNKITWYCIAGFFTGLLLMQGISLLE